MRADRQTAGRGRRGREWVSEAGNLYASTLVRIAPADPPAAQLGFVAAVALFDTLRGWVPESRLSLKWPNDLLLDGRKLSGILLEREGDAVVIGFGVNLAHYPVDVEQPAISLQAAGLTPPSPDAAVQTLAESWSAALGRWRTHGFAPVREAWMERAHKPGAPVAARLSDGQTLRGTYDGIDAGGALLLRLPNGTTHIVHAGDIFAL